VHVTSRIGINALTSWVCSLLSGILGWILVPLYLSELGKEGYGLIGLTASIVAFTMVADLGLREALGRQLAAEAARGNGEAFNKLASSAMVFYLCLSSLIAVLFAVAGPTLARCFAVSANCRLEAVFLIRWFASLSILLTFIGTVYAGTLTSANRFDKVNTITSVTYAIRAVLLIVVLKTTHTGLRGWAVVTLLTETGRVILLSVTAARLKPELSLRLGSFRLESLGTLVKLGVYSFGAQSARLLCAQSDPVVLSLYFGPAVLAVYSPATQLLNGMRPFVNTLAAQLYAVATQFHVRDNSEKVAEMLTAGTRYILLQAAGAVAVLIGFSDSIMQIWLGRKLGADCAMAARVLVALAFVDLMSFASGTQWPVMLGMGRLKVFVATAVPTGIAYIVSSVLLVGYTKLGIYGVLLPNIVLSAVTRVIVSMHAARLCGIRARDYLYLSYIRPLFLFVLLFAVSLALKTAVVPSSYMGLGVCVLVVFVVWAALCWFVGLSAKDRARITPMLYLAFGLLARKRARHAARADGV
jgi:O-antigen/teichoic acid export membrane protein